MKLKHFKNLHRNIIHGAALAAVVSLLSTANATAPESVAAPGNDYFPGELVLKLTAAAGQQMRTLGGKASETGVAVVDTELARLEAASVGRIFDLTTNADEKRQRGLERVLVVQYTGDEDPADAAVAIAALAEVEWAEPNYVARISRTPNDRWFKHQWGHLNRSQAQPYGRGGPVGTPDADIDTTEAWDLETGSGEVTIAIIDTGIDLLHGEFAGRVLDGYDFVNGDTAAWDDNGHGTACAGIAAATGDNSKGTAGVAWNVGILPVKVMDSGGSGSYSNVAAGIEFAADEGADVISLSLGGSSYSSILEDAVDYANSKGALLLAASGNSNANAIIYPAAYSNVAAVGALSPCNDRKDPTTCDGETWWGSNYGQGLDFVAPGVRIYTADIRGSGGYNPAGAFVRDFNGTSAATPFAAGIAALVMSYNGGLSNAEVRNIMQTSADDIDTTGYDIYTGWGRLNAYEALGSAAP